MEILYVLIPLSIILVGLAIRVFIWAVRNDQFDDLEGPAHSILYDDDEQQIPSDAQTSDTKHRQNQRQKQSHNQNDREDDH